MKKYNKNTNIKLVEVENDINNILKYIEKLENLDYDEDTNTLDKDTDVMDKEVKDLEIKLKEKYKDYLDTPEENNTNKI